MQVTSNPTLVDENYASYTDKFRKLRILVDSIVSKNEKCIIWSSYVKNVEFLYEHFKKIAETL